MGKEEIKKLVESSKNAVSQDHDNFTRSIRDDMSSFKKKALDRI